MDFKNLHNLINDYIKDRKFVITEDFKTAIHKSVRDLSKRQDSLQNQTGVLETRVERDDEGTIEANYLESLDADNKSEYEKLKKEIAEDQKKVRFFQEADVILQKKLRRQHDDDDKDFLDNMYDSVSSTIDLKRQFESSLRHSLVTMIQTVV